MQLRVTALASLLAVCAACSPVRRASPALDAPAPDPAFVYGNPEDTTDPLNPSNKGLNPRVVGPDGNVVSFPLKAGGAQLYYGTGQPMRTPKGVLVRATGWVRLNYGMRLDRGGRTYFLAWQTNHDDPTDSGKKNATGWVAADDMTEGVFYCFEDEDVQDAACLMKEKQIRRLVVLNRDRHLVGVVSLGDLAVEAGGVSEVAGKTLEAVSRPS